MRGFHATGFALISCSGAIYRGLDAFSRAGNGRRYTLLIVDSRGFDCAKCAGYVMLLSS